MGKKVGPYELFKEIGRGSFGVVYLGRHLATKNKIAIKMVNRQKLTEEMQNRLQQEIQCQRLVESDYIIRLYDIQKTDNNFYLILEYCQGGDLNAFIKENGPVDEQVAQRWMQQLAQGFQALRNKNILHRDLKLSNILMTEKSLGANVKLADFGMSRVLEDESLAASCLGTPLYMAPEVIKPMAGYDEKADIWSLGMVFYEMLTARPPISARHKEEIPRAQLQLNPIPEFLSQPCQDLLRSMLEHDANKRITFTQLFEHPFIVGNQDRFSNIASKGSSEQASLNSSEPLQLNSRIQPSEITEEDDDEDDFVLLENDSSAVDFVFLAKDTHPALNINLEKEKCEGSISAAKIIVELAEKVMCTNEILGSFALYLKATGVVFDALKNSSDIIQKHQLSPETQPGFYEIFEQLKNAFSQYKEVASIHGQQVEKLALQDLDTLTSIKSIGSQGIADSLIFNYAINKCKDAAADEYLRDYQKSFEQYSEALVLLNLLYENRDSSREDQQEDWKQLNSLILETNERKELVSTKLDSIES